MLEHVDVYVDIIILNCSIDKLSSWHPSPGSKASVAQLSFHCHPAVEAQYKIWVRMSLIPFHFSLLMGIK